jgi:hypothetical protein
MALATQTAFEYANLVAGDDFDVAENYSASGDTKEVAYPIDPQRQDAAMRAGNARGSNCQLAKWTQVLNGRSQVAPSNSPKDRNGSRDEIAQSTELGLKPALPTGRFLAGAIRPSPALWVPESLSRWVTSRWKDAR